MFIPIARMGSRDSFLVHVQDPPTSAVSLQRPYTCGRAFCHEIATQGHSRSFILHPLAGRQWVAYRHIILLAVSLAFLKT